MERFVSCRCRWTKSSRAWERSCAFMATSLAAPSNPCAGARMTPSCRALHFAVLRMSTLSTLDRLEAESIHILREVAANFERPVLLYSIGKDSSVLLHLLLKAFRPAKPPMPMLHVDTTWKFREMIEFRDRRAQETGIKLIVHI